MTDAGPNRGYPPNAMVDQMSSAAKLMAGVPASITDFKANPNAVIRQSGGQVVGVLKNNEPCFYAIAPQLFETMLEAIADQALLAQANARLNDGKEPVEVRLDEL